MGEENVATQTNVLCIPESPQFSQFDVKLALENVIVTTQPQVRRLQAPYTIPSIASC